MYTKREYDRYAAMLKRMGIEDPVMVEKTLDFVYRLSIVAADIITTEEDDGNEKQEDQRRQDKRGQEDSGNLDTSKHERAS